MNSWCLSQASRCNHQSLDVWVQDLTPIPMEGEVCEGQSDDDASDSDDGDHESDDDYNPTAKKQVSLLNLPNASL